MPWLAHDEPHIDIDDVAQTFALDQLAEREHVRAEPQLKIQRRDEAAIPADPEIRRAAARSSPIGF